MTVIGEEISAAVGEPAILPPGLEIRGARSAPHSDAAVGRKYYRNDAKNKTHFESLPCYDLILARYCAGSCFVHHQRCARRSGYRLRFAQPDPVKGVVRWGCPFAWLLPACHPMIRPALFHRPDRPCHRRARRVAGWVAGCGRRCCRSISFSFLCWFPSIGSQVLHLTQAVHEPGDILLDDLGIAFGVRISRIQLGGAFEIIVRPLPFAQCFAISFDCLPDGRLAARKS